jgi:hypothetical protein
VKKTTSNSSNSLGRNVSHKKRKTSKNGPSTKTVPQKMKIIGKTHARKYACNPCFKPIEIQSGKKREAGEKDSVSNPKKNKKK